jgi:hypothetical protein
MSEELLENGSVEKEKKTTLDRLQLIEIMQAAQKGDQIPLRVTGGSMIPFLFDQRSLVFLEKDPDYVPKKGDIVFFVRPDLALVLHRIVEVRKDGTLLINGDAQSWTEVIHPKQILGHVTHIRRRVRVFSVNSRFYRLAVRLWMPLRRLHPVLSVPFFYWNCLVFKLSRRYRNLYS